MKSSLRLVVLLFLVLLCRGENTEKNRCSEEIFLRSSKELCSISLCQKLCQKALDGSVVLRAYCTLSDTCNCVYRC
ncbi:hypothetical protein ABFS82_03G004200 [Erythranthe guttata]